MTDFESNHSGEVSETLLFVQGTLKMLLAWYNSLKVNSGKRSAGLHAVTPNFNQTTNKIYPEAKFLPRGPFRGRDEANGSIAF